MKKPTEEFSLAKFYAEQPKAKKIWAFVPRYLVQYAEGYALYRYDQIGRIMSKNTVCAEAVHIFYKALLKAIPEKKGYKVPDYQMNRKAATQEDAMEALEVYIPYTTYRHLKQAIEFGYLYCNYAKPSLSCIVREALQQHYTLHHNALSQYLKNNPWLIL